jgi:hypothetical protein
MTTQKDTTGSLVDGLSLELYQIAKVTSLCAFAAEARRTLDEIDLAASLFPEIGTTLLNHVECRNEWTTHEDVLGLVLKEVSLRIEAVKRRLETEVGGYAQS